LARSLHNGSAFLESRSRAPCRRRRTTPPSTTWASRAPTGALKPIRLTRTYAPPSRKPISAVRPSRSRWKRDIVSQLDELTPEAKAIGAVNTVIPFTNADGHLGVHGDNADWIRIRNIVKARLPPSLNKVDSCLAIGTGGTVRTAIHARSRRRSDLPAQPHSAERRRTRPRDPGR